MHALYVALIAFGSVFLVELPDKTLVATLVLTTRYRRAPVLLGVAAAFAVQCTIAVTAGGLLRLLPTRVVDIVVAVLFGLGAALLLRAGFGHPDDEQDEAADAPFPVDTTSAARTVAISFGVLFAAEWGDASQLATAALQARYGEAVAVGLGSFLALMTVAALASVLSKLILQRVDVAWIHRAAGTLFTVFAIIAMIAAVRA